MRESKEESWARLIAEQEAGSETVRAFCRRVEIGEKAFYWWRRRLRDEEDVRFAVVETRRAPALGQEWGLELLLVSGVYSFTAGCLVAAGAFAGGRVLASLVFS